MLSKVRNFSTLIPSLLTSAKSVWDISGKSVIELNYDLLQLDDAKAIQQDWQTVGDDMRKAFRCMDNELSSNPDLKKEIVLKIIEN